MVIHPKVLPYVAVNCARSVIDCYRTPAIKVVLMVFPESRMMTQNNGMNIITFDFVDQLKLPFQSVPSSHEGTRSAGPAPGPRGSAMPSSSTCT
ncbi:hypothetical protein EVAR_33860_1 [Eumeta japonica]|uniref:Uncharacterized protein n=1 Tax=Eumeta variegata TaxID=151549 RepID=A0A4C1X5R7_EUMVA|nr:hypothetical protein EVAR_33860_1 [Eumeta japonica]